MKRHASISGRIAALVVALLLAVAGSAPAMIDGITGSVFDLTAKAGHISIPDGDSLMVWGYANGNGTVQYPGPTLIVNEGDVVTVRLRNQLPRPVSIVFPGQEVKAIGGVVGALTREALNANDPATPANNEALVVYTFTATRPGTYLYYSGSNPSLAVEMGLVGALIVRPANFGTLKSAYGDARSAYDYEFLFLLTEMDPRVHYLVEQGRFGAVDTTTFFPTLWFINGRAAPDTMAPAGAAWLPTQPYDCMPRTTPGKRVLLRILGAGRESHPYHTHGNHTALIARDGRLLESSLGASVAGEVGTLPDLRVLNFTNTIAPGGTYDAIYTWTGRELGWDIFGHQPSDPLAPGEYAPDHGKPFPVVLPSVKDLTFGQFWSGSPFLGDAGFLPPGQGGFNKNGGILFMWHSHSEKELTNNDIFPGGMLTMMVVEPPGTPIE
jgi:FtsP/CotA-like multicopper oxidase with cupredoxin domain